MNLKLQDILLYKNFTDTPKTINSSKNFCIMIHLNYCSQLINIIGGKIGETVEPSEKGLKAILSHYRKICVQVHTMVQRAPYCEEVLYDGK